MNLHAWQVWMTSAETAKIRLHGVVAQDRKACGDGKWVLMRKKNSWAAYVHAKLGRWEDATKMSKDLYRWVTRR